MKISLAINSKNPVEEWLDKCIETAMDFDEILVYLDGDSRASKTVSNHVKILSDGKERTIVEGFNHVIAQTTGDWVCSFCDDDYFSLVNLRHLLSLMRKHRFADNADVIHFPVYLTSGGSWGHFESVTPEMLHENNYLPHGSFIRRKLFDDLGGYRIDPAADWNLWLRAAKSGARFKYFDKPVYYFRYGHERSAWQKQVNQYGQNVIKEMVLQNA